MMRQCILRIALCIFHHRSETVSLLFLVVPSLEQKAEPFLMKAEQSCDLCNYLHLVNVSTWSPTIQNFGVGFLIFPFLRNRGCHTDTTMQPSPLHHPSLANARKLQAENVWKYALCAIKSRILIIFNIKNGFFKAISERIFCMHFVHCSEDKNIITTSSPPPAVTQEKGGGTERNYMKYNSYTLEQTINSWKVN